MAHINYHYTLGKSGKEPKNDIKTYSLTWCTVEKLQMTCRECYTCSIQLFGTMLSKRNR